MFPYDKNKIRNAFEQPAPCLPLSFASCCPQRPGLSILSTCLAPAVYQGYLKKKERKQSEYHPPHKSNFPRCWSGLSCLWLFMGFHISYNKTTFQRPCLQMWFSSRVSSMLTPLGSISPLHKGCMVIHIIFPTLERQRQESRELKVILDYIASLRLVWSICDLTSIHPSTSQSPKVMEFNQAVGNNMFIIFEPVTSTLWNLC